MFRIKWKFSLILLSLFVLGGCSTLGVKKPTGGKPVVSVAGKQALWKKRQAVMARKAAWNLNSKVALRYRADHWSFALKWLQQSANQYIMEIKNPVTGGLLAKLSRNNSQVSLLADDGKTYRDSNEERLLLRQTGVKLPLKGMQYWVRGLASPRYKVEKLVLDASGRPQVLYQAGWKIEYSRYTNNRFDAMPQRVVITRTENSVYLKMIIKQWY